MLLSYLFKASILALIVLPCFGKTREGKETKRTSSTTDSGAVSRTGVKTGLNESMSRNTPEESSPVPASLESESESESESMYI